MPVDHTDTSDSGRQSSRGKETVEWRSVAHRSFDRDGDVDLVMEIVEAVAAAEGIETRTLGSSLFEAVNVTAIEAVFFERSILGQQRHCTGTVQFRYRGFRVTVTSDGQVIVAEPVHSDARE